MNINKIKKNQKIYFICYGTSTNDIINSLNKNITNTQKKSIFSAFFSKGEKENKNEITKIEQDEFSKLTTIGIKECYMCQENNENNDIFKNILNQKKNIYTSLDYNAIESSFVLFHKFNDLNIIPLPFMSSTTNIKTKKTFDIFKKKFGKTNNITNLKNYWSTKNVNNQFLNIKNISSKINWEKTNDEKLISLNSFSMTQFKKILENMCFENPVILSESVF
jgi:hypothetical protein